MSLAVKRYSEALMDVCSEENCLDEVYDEFKMLYEQMKSDADFGKLMTEPVLSSEEKKELTEKVLSGGNVYLVSFIKTLIDRSRTEELPDMFREFEVMYKEKKNILEAEAVTAVEMSEEQTEKVKKELSEKFGKTVVLKTSVDPSIIGGMVLYVGDRMYDASIKAKFEGLKKELKTIQISQKENG
jgi:F-type H+-transporting ATPase subunit delta